MSARLSESIEESEAWGMKITVVIDAECVDGKPLRPGLLADDVRAVLWDAIDETVLWSGDENDIEVALRVIAMEP